MKPTDICTRLKLEYSNCTFKEVFSGKIHPLVIMEMVQCGKN